MLDVRQQDSNFKGLQQTSKNFLGEMQDMAAGGYALSSTEAILNSKNGSRFFAFKHPTTGAYVNVGVSAGAIREYGVDVDDLAPLPVYKAPQLMYVLDADKNRIPTGKVDPKTGEELFELTPVIEKGKQVWRYFIGRPLPNGGVSAKELMALCLQIKEKLAETVKPV